MKRGRKQPRKQKPKPHETMDGLRTIVENGQMKLWGHDLKWKKEKHTEAIAIAICTRCSAVAVIALRPAGIENVITGDAANKECPNRHEEKQQ